MEEQPAIREVSVWEKPKVGELGHIVHCAIRHANMRFIGDPVKFRRHALPTQCICPNTHEKPYACPLHPSPGIIGRYVGLGHDFDEGEIRYASWVLDRNDKDDPSALKIAEFDVHIFDKIHEWFKRTGRNPGRLDAPRFQIVEASEVTVRMHFGPRLGYPRTQPRYTVVEEDHRVTLTPIEEEMSPKEFAAIGMRDLRIELVEKFKATKPSVIEAMLVASSQRSKP